MLIVYGLAVVSNEPYAKPEKKSIVPWLMGASVLGAGLGVWLYHSKPTLPPALQRMSSLQMNPLSMYELESSLSGTVRNALLKEIAEAGGHVQGSGKSLSVFNISPGRLREIMAKYGNGIRFSEIQPIF